MPAKRRTRRRAKRRGVSPQVFRVIAAVVLVGAFVYVALATTVGTFVAEKVIAPIFRALSGEESETSATPSTTGYDTDPAEESSALALTPSEGYSPASAAPVSTERATSEVRLDEKVYYSLQLGAFSSEQNAENMAAELKGRAAAGYVYFDGELYRVLAAAYESKEDAQTVKTQLLEKNGLDSKVTELVLPAVALKVTAGEDQLAAVQEAFSAADSACSGLFEICEGYDKGEFTASQVSEKLVSLAESCEEPAGALSGASGGEAEKLAALLMSMAEDFRDCASNAGENSVAFSAVLKYTQIKEVCAFAEFLKGIE